MPEATADRRHIGADNGDREGADASAARTAARPAGTQQVANITGPANLIVDGFTLNPEYRRTQRPPDADGARHPVLRRQRRARYGTATPFNQFAIPAEQPTGADGNTTLTFQRLSGYPVSNHQELIAMFLRARKPGENVLNGITGYRLVSVPVDLNR